MDQQTLLYIMTAFVVLSGIALVAQAVAIIALYKGVKATEQRLLVVLPKVELLVETSQKTIEQGRTQILEITKRTSDILDSARTQLARVDELMADATGRARIQLERAEALIDDTLSRAQQTVGMVHSGVMRPMREIQGVTAGIKTAIAFLAKGNRRSVAQVTQDEEMFI
jgi:flagellar motility protein MotE (MotC chaperone)